MKSNLIIIIFLVLITLPACDKTSDNNVDIVERPTLNTNSISSITTSTATCGGDITSNGGSNIIARGVCWNTSQYPTTANNKTSDGIGKGSFTSTITGLAQDGKYYVRAYATNSVGTTYGNEQSFSTEKGVQPITDIDGNVYNTVVIGTQTWMVENLKTTKYRNGDYIANVTDNTSWAALTIGAFCDYNNTPSNSITYGKLYNWFAVNDSRNIAPIGWHVPSDAEWTVLTTYLGGLNVAGGKLKQMGTTKWTSPNYGATNSSGFNALPGGYRYSNGEFDYVTIYGEWWSSSINTTTYAFFRYLSFADEKVAVSTNNKLCGLSIRCVKD